MKKKLFHFGMLYLIIALNALVAQDKQNKVEHLDEVVVSATKFASKKEHIGKIIYQIKAEEIANLKGKTVADVLENISSISINGSNSAAGKNKSTYIRGGRDRQVLVLIDGVPVSDPSGINTTFDLRLLTLSQVEAIEVMNGAASTLYGSGAATGIINIILKKSAQKPFSVNYEVSLGTNNSQDESDLALKDINQNISLTGTLNKFNYLASINLSKVNGLSDAISENSTVIFEKDAFNASNVFARLGYNFSEKLNVSVLVNFDEFTYDYDGGAFFDSTINNGKNKQHRVGLSSSFKYNTGLLKLIAAFNTIDRVFDSYNSWTMETDHFEYTGKSQTVDLVNNYNISDEFQLITGINYIKHRNQTNSPFGNIDEDLANYELIDPYLTVVYNTPFGLNISAGARLNNHSEYGNHFVYNFNPSFNITDDLKIISSYSSAFIAPSTYQLFSFYGNTDLNPEEDITIEAGLTYTNKNKFEINSVFFYREEDSAIILPDFIAYQNAIETLFAKGVETEVKINAIEDVTFRLGHTYTYKSADLDYIPKNKFTALIETSLLENTYLSLRLKNISERTYFDQWGSGSTIELNSYNLVDFYGGYELIKNRLTVFGQVNNIFDAIYVETIGFTTKGRNFKIGLNFTY